MKQRDILEGCTYCNAGKGRPRRTASVTEINATPPMDCFPDGWTAWVHYSDENGGRHRILLSEFANWAGKKVGE